MSYYLIYILLFIVLDYLNYTFAAEAPSQDLNFFDDVTVTGVEDFPKSLIAYFLLGVSELELFKSNPKFLKTELWFRHKKLDKKYFGLWCLIFDYYYYSRRSKPEFELALFKALEQMNQMRKKAYPHDPLTVQKGLHCEHVFKALKNQKCNNGSNFMIYLISLTYRLEIYIQKAILLLFVMFCTNSIFFGMSMKDRVEKFLSNRGIMEFLVTESDESLSRYVSQCSNESPKLFEQKESSLSTQNLSMPFIFSIRSPAQLGNLSCLSMIELYRSGISNSFDFTLLLLFLLPRMKSADISLLVAYLLMDISSYEGSYQSGIRTFFINSNYRNMSLNKISSNFGVNLDGFLNGFLQCIIEYERTEMLPGAEELNLPDAKRYVELIRSKK